MIVGEVLILLKDNVEAEQEIMEEIMWRIGKYLGCIEAP